MIEFMGIGLKLMGMVVFLMFSVKLARLVSDRLTYRAAKKDIFRFVEGYKSRCVGNNRFLVTVEDLQNSFREYDTRMIQRVWVELISSKVIQQDPMDNEWCVR